ncbi:hypothetical protein GGQ85_003992 [Nitrobacter vulgaris]|uniref:hypothetical protein n=1 Tax=Nitrobacter vulgaris TaxID=29421 RepID=UPI00285CDBC0|nr:hypothetical protein [Nitrobacter vulgaris]MDR6306263.1 hypothetical protein [Nitrobacter vulgaris]
MAYALGKYWFKQADLSWSTSALVIPISIILQGIIVTPAMRFVERRRSADEKGHVRAHPVGTNEKLFRLGRGAGLPRTMNTMPRVLPLPRQRPDLRAQLQSCNCTLNGRDLRHLLTRYRAMLPHQRDNQIATPLLKLNKGQSVIFQRRGHFC